MLEPMDVVTGLSLLRRFPQACRCRGPAGAARGLTEIDLEQEA